MPVKAEANTETKRLRFREIVIQKFRIRASGEGSRNRSKGLVRYGGHPHRITVEQLLAERESQRDEVHISRSTSMT